MEYPVDMEREDMKLPEISNVITPEQMYAAHGGSEDTDCEATLAPDGSYVSFTSTSTDPMGKPPFLLERGLCRLAAVCPTCAATRWSVWRIRAAV